MKRPKKTNAERNRAKYLRGKKKHSKLTAAEEKWLARYEQDTVRWSRPIDDQGDDERVSSSSAPVHTAEPVTGGGPQQFTALPMLPPAVSEPSATGEVLSGSQPGPGSVAGSHAPAASPVGPEPEPLLAAAPPPAADPALLAAGAQRFAGLVVAVNAFGIKALLELFPAGALPMPPGMDELIRDPRAHAGLLEAIRLSAVELAHQHPWLCSVGPSPAAVVLGSTSISLAACYFRFLRPMVQGDQVEVVDVSPPPRRAAAPPPPPPRGSNGVHRAPRAEDVEPVFTMDDVLGGLPG